MATTGVTNRKYISDVIPETKRSATADWSFARVTVKSPSGAGDLTLDPIGQALIADGANSFVVMQDLDTIPATGATSLTGAPKVAILAGDVYCAGKNDTDIVVTEAGITATVFIGHGVVVEEGLVFDAVSSDAAMTAEKALFLAQLKLQEVVVKSQATSVTPTYTA